MHIVLRAAGAVFDVDRCLVWLPPQMRPQVWHAGERDVLRRTLDTSGFSVSLAEDEHARTALKLAYENLDALSSNLEELIADGVDVWVDFGLFVYSSTPQTLAIPRQLLAKLVSLGVSVVVSAYPCSDDDDR